MAKALPEIKHQVHNYISVLHSGRDEEFNRVYQAAHDEYFGQLPKQEV
ncbi:MAG: hypothetical protein HFG65_12860 [Hungatella sp.]|nr:hypothetical protein [Hungatella sp.]